MFDNIRIRSTQLFVVITLLIGSGLPVIDSASGQEKQSPEIRFSLDAISRLDALTYVPNTWGEFLLRLENRGTDARSLHCTSYFDGQSTLQYGRRMWVPPRCRMVLPHPVKLPTEDQFPDGRGTVRSMVLDNTEDSETIIKSGSGRVHHERSLLITNAGRNTGIIAGWHTNDEIPTPLKELIVGTRLYQGLSRKIVPLAGHFLPSDETSLKYLDHLVIAEDRLLNDPAGLQAVRRWLHSGGRLWIMLDLADPLILERLLGDSYQGAAVDRVELNSVRIDKPPTVFVPDGVIGTAIEHERPVAMTRILATGMTVENTVNGWPAAFTTTYGEGRLLVTTLGARAWMKAAPPNPNIGSDEKALTTHANFLPLSPMEDLAPFIFARRSPKPLSPETLQTFAKEFVSHNVPTWSLIVGTMAGFLAVLALMGGVLWWRDRLEHLAWSGSLLSVVFGGLFLNIGLTNRHQVPDTIATVQFAQAIGGTDDVRTQSVAVLYRPEGGNTEIQTSDGGEFWPDMTGVDDSTRRMVTTDLGAFTWEGLAQPSGLGVYPITTSNTFNTGVTARATLNAMGLTGEYAGISSTGADSILATGRGRISLQTDADGKFTASAENVLATDQYLDATFLTDVQDRRRRVLENLFSSETWRNSLDQPQLLLWVNDWKHGFQFGEGLQRHGDALLAFPLQLQRPAPNTEIRIPSPLLNYESCRPPDGSAASGFWDDARQEWQERSGASSTWLAIKIPRELLPLKARKASIEVVVSGPLGMLEIKGVKNGEIVGLASIADPVGTVPFEIEDVDALTVSSDGDVILGFSVGASTGESASNNSPAAGIGGAAGNPVDADYWKFESLSIELQATVTDLTEEN